jgi:hypothetical protein
MAVLLASKHPRAPSLPMRPPRRSSRCPPRRHYGQHAAHERAHAHPSMVYALTT